MRIKRYFLVLSLCLTILTAGCWDYTDIEDLATPFIAAYDTPHMVKDKNVEDAKISVTFLFPDVNLSGSEVFIKRTTASNIGEARNKRALTSFSSTILRGSQAMIFGEQLAKTGIELDIFLRRPSVKNSMLIAAVKGRGDDFIIEGTKTEKKLGEIILGLLKTTSHEAFVVQTTLHDMSINQTTPGKNIIMPLLELTDNQEIKIAGSAIFKKNRLIDTIDQLQTRTLVLLNGIKCSGNIKFEIHEKGKLIDEGTVLMSNKRKVKISKKGDKYYFDIKIELIGDLLEHYNTQGFTNMLTYNKKIENAVEKQIEKECEDFLAHMQNEYKIDCIDISKYALAKWRKELEEKIDDEEFITKAVINVEVKAKIDNIGELT